MRRLMLMLVLAAALLAALTADAAAARPPVSIGVAPSKIQANLTPGQLYKTDLDVFNKGAGPVTLDVYLQDYTVSAASAVAFKPAGSLAESAAPWSTLNTKVLHMPAHSHRRVVLRVDVPATVAIGTHTLAVVFRSRQIKSDGNLRYQPAVASLMAAGVRNPDGSGLVLRGQAVTRSVSVQWISLRDVWSSSDHLGAIGDWLFHPTVVAHVQVRNTGNTFFNIIRGDTTFSTKFAAGSSGTSVAAPTYTILPNSVRTLDMPWKGAPFLARGDAQTRIYYNDSTHLPVTSTPFLIIPWHLIIVVVVLISMIVAWRVARRRGHGGGRKSGKVAAPSPWISSGSGI
ncbi:MAG TPA: hypothetical protein VGP67_03325 [Gaiellales bacterium]|nr:hypothetical protein [Gaiellales bacterium]